jgi:hypothetical protein
MKAVAQLIIATADSEQTVRKNALELAKTCLFGNEPQISVDERAELLISVTRKLKESGYMELIVRVIDQVMYLRN